MTTKEPQGAAYEVCTSMISALNRQLDQCEETTNPWEARYKFDAIIPFVNTMDEALEGLSDEAERDTCREQFKQMVDRGKAMAPSIPLICQQCGDAYGPDPDGLPRTGDEPEICAACKNDGQAE